MRIVGYLWAAPVTLVGLPLALLAAATGGGVRARGGVVEVWGGAAGRLLRGGAAMALGHVILARDAACLERSRRHELVHVRQYEQWGPLLLPAYWLVAMWLRWRGLHPYLDHPLEPPPLT
ncbi:hypothetical protein [Urbifossiella limnaea]|uniref:Signal peptide prediction n=1 Tax=Urbifossiella limnaea TaxID=2528023 RepID=A0A517XYH1_9BACT|nr:hypothetical protein [Urbifossiella limnaea]QDU22580.1 hypothetical protein ETAA1_45630 [Urbifossiella limnaea]